MKDLISLLKELKDLLISKLKTIENEQKQLLNEMKFNSLK